MCLLHRVFIFQLYLEFVWRNSIFLVKSLLIYDSRSILKCSYGTFMTFIQENGVPRGKLQLLGFFQYNFWHKISTLNEVNSCIGTPRGLVLVYVVLRPIICKTVSRISDRIKGDRKRFFVSVFSISLWSLYQNKTENCIPVWKILNMYP
jgi:hypothetical protein